MKYKIYFKGSLCKAFDADERAFQVNAPTRSGYPFAFETSIELSTEDNYVTYCITPLNEKSQYLLEERGIIPYVSVYTRHYPTWALSRGSMSGNTGEGKKRHWKWSRKEESNEYFYDVYFDGVSYYATIDLDRIDDRVLNENYRVSLMSEGAYKEHPENYINHTGSLAVAFRLVFKPADRNGDRMVGASEPRFLLFSQVGGGSYDSIEEITEEDYILNRRSFDDEWDPLNN